LEAGPQQGHASFFPKADRPKTRLSAETGGQRDLSRLISLGYALRTPFPRRPCSALNTFTCSISYGTRLTRELPTVHRVSLRILLHPRMFPIPVLVCRSSVVDSQTVKISRIFSDNCLNLILLEVGLAHTYTFTQTHPGRDPPLRTHLFPASPEA